LDSDAPQDKDVEVDWRHSIDFIGYSPAKYERERRQQVDAESERHLEDGVVVATRIVVVDEHEFAVFS
jgi:hypothetical protein